MFSEGEVVIYLPDIEVPIWHFRVGKQARVLRDQEHGAVTVKIQFDDESEPCYAYAAHLVTVAG